MYYRTAIQLNKTLEHNLEQQCFQLRMDNPSACQEDEGPVGVVSPQRAHTLPGKENMVADLLVATSAESRLDPQVCKSLMQILGPCTVDLFATRLNTQLDRFVSWMPDPFTAATDALSLPWQNLQGYAFPPFCLIGRCLRKVQQERSTILLVAWQQSQCVHVHLAIDLLFFITGMSFAMHRSCMPSSRLGESGTACETISCMPHTLPFPHRPPLAFCKCRTNRSL